MIEKLTLEQFQQIKSQLEQLVKQYEDFYDEIKMMKIMMKNYLSKDLLSNI